MFTLPECFIDDQGVLFMRGPYGKGRQWYLPQSLQAPWETQRLIGWRMTFPAQAANWRTQPQGEIDYADGKSVQLWFAPSRAKTRTISPFDSKPQPIGRIVRELTRYEAEAIHLSRIPH